MNKILIIVLASSLLPCCSYAQTMNDMVREMPDSLLPLLTRNNRLDFVDYLESGMEGEATNKLTGKSKMLKLTSDFTLMQLTPSSTLQIKLLPEGDHSIVSVIRTVAVSDSVFDSQIRFYTTNWTPLPTSTYFSIPADSDVCRLLSFSEENTNLSVTDFFPSIITYDNEPKKAPQKQELYWNGKGY